MSIGKATLALAVVAALASGTRAEGPRVTVRGNGTELGPTPFLVPLDVELSARDYVLLPASGGPALGGHVLLLGEHRFLGFVLDRLGAEETRAFRLEPQMEILRGVPPDAQEEGVEIVKGSHGAVLRLRTVESPPNMSIDVKSEGDEVRVLAAGEPFTTLRRGASKPFFWPLIGPSGEPITRAFPMEDVEGEDHDHPHQRSFWFTHGDVNGWDFWASDPKNGANPKFGTIWQNELDIAEGGMGVGVIRTRDDWHGGDGKKVCEDERTFVFSASKDVRFIDVDVTIRAMDGPVTFGDTKEGMFGLRVASSMDANRKPGGRIVNAEGLTDTDAWGKPSPWVDYSGPVGGKTVGVAIFDSPANLRHPTTWHVRDYGLFAANPFGYHDFGVKQGGKHTIPAGGSLRFRYRVMLQEGDAESAKVAAAFRAFAEPPKVTVEVD
jgi:hypothetical protein